MIRITINNEPTEIAEAITLADLLASRGIDVSRGGVAAAINDRLITRARWTETVLAEGDKVVVVNAAYGG
jgi:sulfur carrier protein